ncbi:hypothetical protein QQA43_30245 (plasmid) [Mycolicibacterium vanbaalenii]|uniref:hypothetical protein n=1 Tax=Mycolicibacterium vanbaalenii TaxID=110539 RepID=UPI001F2BA491|nr:hypothetical protein [Mycolicibacterium vanbaalenii]WND60129.1 hypothetical protein QQA43_30245 [Mycolicibacterium vanbaalenii]
MNDRDSAPRINNARKAAARRLQQQYPGLKYIQAYAATAPDAQVWQQFARVGGAVHVQACAIQIGEAARRLLCAAANCGESSERQRLWEGGQFSVWLATRLAEVETYVRTVEVTTPLMPRMKTAGWPPVPEPLHNGTDPEIVELLHQARHFISGVQSAPEIPAAVQDLVVQTAAVHRWASTPLRP